MFRLSITFALVLSVFARANDADTRARFAFALAVEQQKAQEKPAPYVAPTAGAKPARIAPPVAIRRLYRSSGGC